MDAKMTDEGALAVVKEWADSCAECNGLGYVVTYTDPYNRGDVSSPERKDCADCAGIRESIAHIAARLGGGEAPVAWLHVRKRDGMIRGHTTEPPSEVMLACAEADGDEYRPVYYSPPARLAATAVGVTEKMVEAGCRQRWGQWDTLKETDRRVLRVHFRADLEAALANQTKD